MAVITLANWLATRRRRRSCDCLLNVCVQWMLPHIERGRIATDWIIDDVQWLLLFLLWCANWIDLMLGRLGPFASPEEEEEEEIFALCGGGHFQWAFLSFLFPSFIHCIPALLFSTLVVGCYHSFFFIRLPSSFMNHTRTAAAVLTSLSLADC